LLPGQQRPVRALVGFASVALDVGAESTVTIACSTRPLQRWTADGFVFDAGTVEIEAGAFSGDSQASAATLVHDPLQAVGEHLAPTTRSS
jgi:beta-glucosidase